MENEKEYELGRYRLMHTLMGCRAFDDILREGRKLFHHPMVLCDLTFRTLAITDEPNLQDQTWNEILHNGGVPMQHTHNAGTIDCYRRSVQERHCIQEHSTGGGPAMLRRALCAVGSRVMGYLFAPNYETGDFTEEERAVFDIIGDLCALRMEQELHYGTRPEDMKDFFLADLLAGRITDARVVRERLRFFHMDLTLPVQIITLRPASRPRASFLFHNACQELAAHYPGWISFEYDRSYKLIAPAVTGETFSPEALARLTGLLQERNLVAGISRFLTDLTQIAEHNAQSEKALELGLKYHGELYVHLYDDLSIYEILEHYAASGDVRKLCHSAVFTLRSFDRAHGTSLMETFETYLCCNRSIPETAERLSVHRNTVSYRLRKINELIHVNLDNSETVFHLLFSCHVLEFESHRAMREPEERAQL